MARQPQTSPRKAASQERSRLTVDALLEATARILVKEGYDRASTNRIARLAGVSIGSLYQYFPSKEALVAAVIDRHMQEMMAQVRAALREVARRPVEVAARELVRVMIEAHRVDPRLHRVLVEQIPRTGRLQNIEALDREAYGLVRGYLEAHREELGVADPDLAAFVCVQTVEALTHAAVLHRPEALADAAVETFIDEVALLLSRYLRGERAAVDQPPLPTLVGRGDLSEQNGAGQPQEQAEADNVGDGGEKDARGGGRIGAETAQQRGHGDAGEAAAEAGAGHRQRHHQR
jgi:AcrR family transcriptional regulator